jgi:AcrR family transcriptional regulator
VTEPTKGADARRERVLGEATRQLNAGGVSQMSLHDVADRLGLSRAALYYYCEDRADLVYQCYRYACRTTAQRLEEALSQDGPLLARVSAYLRRALDDPEVEPSYISEIGYLRPEHRTEVIQRIDRNVARLAEALAAAVETGELRPCDTSLTARTLLNMASFLPFARHWGIETPKVSRARAIAALEAVIAEGWAAPGSPPVTIRPIDLSPLKPRLTEAFDRQRLTEAKQEAILATASRMFNQQGVDTTSLDQVAAALGSTKRTLYHHIGDKAALVAACYRRAFRIHLFALDQAAAQQPALARFGAYHQALALAQLNAELSPLRPLDGLDLLDAAEQASIRTLARERTERLRAIFRDGEADGSLRPLDRDAALLILPGATSWMSKGLLPAGTDPEPVAAEVSRLLAHGLQAAPS